MRWLALPILMAPAFAAAAPAIPMGEMSAARADKTYMNGVYWLEVVRYNANHAIRCRLRPRAWADIAINQARVQLTQNGYWMKAYGRVSATRKSAISTEAQKLAARSYAMPCRDLASMPLIQFYDGAQSGGFIPMPDLMR